MPPARNYGPAAPGGANGNLYFSLDIGALHLVLYNSETPDDTGSVDAAEVAWLEADLAAAVSANATWLIAGAHRPLYCTNGAWNTSDKDCSLFAGVMRAQAETTFNKHKVDLVLGAHMHGYERTQAVNGGKVVTAAANGTTYVRAGAPVYIVNGAGGNREGNEDPHGDAPWSVPGAHYSTTGFGLITVSASRMQYDFVDAASGAVLDTAVWTK